MYEKMFSEGKIGKVTLKNRLVMTAMGINLANYDGTPSPAMLAYYEARAKGGAGLIIPEITRIDELTGRALMRQLAVTEDKHIKPLAELAERVHKHGAKIFIQLHHPGRENNGALQAWLPVVAPSAIRCKYSLEETRALKKDEIKFLIQEFIDGARRVRKAGCDGVELHAAHGYLINEFLSPYTNKRTDEYGGSFENRLRFIKEIIEGIRLECGADFPISVRLSVDEFLNMTGVTEDYIHLEDGIQIAMALEKMGIDVLNVSCGIYETALTCIEPISFPQGWRAGFVKAVKEKLSIPVIAVGVIREPEFAEKLLQGGVLDFVGMGRSWLADEQWGIKAQQGRDKEIRKCISCVHCFDSLLKNMPKGQPPECSLNPTTAREFYYGELQKDSAKHKVVVVGAGPAGLVAAQTLAERGIETIVLEKADKIGGQVNLAAQVPLKERMQWVMDYYNNEIERLNIDLRLNTQATAEAIKELAPDGVIVASGSKPIVPNIPGVEGNNVYSVETVLNGRSGLKGKKVVVVGAGMTGLETAEYLCQEGNQVIIIDMAKKVGAGAYSGNVVDVMGRLKKYGVQVALLHKLKEITDSAVVADNLYKQKEVVFAADAVVLSLGQKPENTLAEELKAQGFNVKTVGDAHKAGIIAAATREGFEAARSMFL